MLFNSIDFAIFLPIVFILYWLLNRQSLKLQNLQIVLSSYVFYGWWDYRFLVLIVFSTVADYLIGLQLQKTQSKSKRKILLWISISVNIGLLGFFKYFNFFVDNFVSAFSFFGSEIQPNTLSIILPVGISFYTFQTLSYTIDVYNRKLEPKKNIIAFAAFVSFFPQLVAGPIERATNLLPQFYKKRVFRYNSAVDGLRQILWGLFKKIVIADNCAFFVNTIFNNHSSYSGSTLLLGAVFFAFQIYGDFSGYSDIAIGTSRLFGFNLKQNFAFPYFSRNIAEFWRRWHISLSTWFRDYVYIPLGGSRVSKLGQIRNVLIIFLVSGFWHGANWTFIIWGLLNGLCFLPLMLIGENRKYTNVVAKNTKLPSIRELVSMLITFVITVIGWIFFRAENLSHAWSYISGLFEISLFSIPEVRPSFLIVLIILFLIIEWLGRRQLYAIETLFLSSSRVVRWGLYFVLIFFMGIFMETKETPFIYFQF